MADELEALLDRVEDPALRSDLRAAIARVRAKRSFGLVFESHIPERVRLPDHPVRRGTQVVPRDGDGDPLLVSRVRNRLATLVGAGGDTEEVDVGALEVVAEFGQAIYPGLAHLGSVGRGGEKPAHIVINAENHHALEALLFTHTGEVDCIYIDPPYNTGARDWKYDNDYVDTDDAYRHSKWLAFMERRLRLAKQLLNPDQSVLVVTIDEKEYLRLGMLLEQIFPSAVRQMATIVINPSGAGGVGLNRVDEYAFFVWMGSATPSRWSDDLLTDTDDAANPRVRGGLSWESLLRSGTQWYRSERPNLCYPVQVDEDSLQIVGVGSPFEGEDESTRRGELDGFPVAWPVRRDGRLGIWRVEPSALIELVQNGYAYVSRHDAARSTWSLKYLLKGTIDLIESGEVTVTRTGHRGQVVADRPALIGKMAKTVWNRSSHNAGKHGSDLITALLPGRSFPFPKSLYAVEDALRIAVADRPDAVVLDFFAGSGTTAHAVMRLNHQDGGRRQSISVTNNEVSINEAGSLRASGYRPGDPEWEALGIFEHIARPRITAAVTGVTPDGEPINGDYKFVDEFPMAEGFEENVEFFKLNYLDPLDAELRRAFAAVAPLLWMRAGGAGSMIKECLDPSGRRRPYALAERYGVLFDPDAWRAFTDRLPDSATSAFVVTDSPSTFAGIAAALPDRVEAVRLYESYLSTFAINRGR